MKLYQKVVVLFVGILAVPAMSFAETSTDIQLQIDTLQARVAELLSQIDSLKAQLQTTQQEVASVTQELRLTRSLYYGLEGEDVEDLQEWLSQYPDIYPEKLVTGYFGRLTEKAVKKYQKKYGIEQVGIVGPKTRAHIHDKYKKDGYEYKDAKKGDDDDDRGESYENKYGYIQDHKTYVCHNDKTLSVASASLKAHLAHGDTEGKCGDVVTPGDTIPPVLSSISVTPATTSAVVTWTTDEMSDSVVKYALTSPVETAGSKVVVTDASDVTSHTVTLTGLTASTTYHYVVMSTDISGNGTTSLEGTFTTNAEVVVDMTPPTILGLSVDASSTEASVLWSTDELADAMVYFATSSSVLDTTYTMVEDTNLLLAHSLVLPGLSASTTYYYIAVSADGVGNTSTSTEAIFTTLD